MLSTLRKLLGDTATSKADLDQALVVDVRTPGEFNAGHLESSINIPLDEIQNHVNDFKNSGSRIVLICRSGARSGRATKFLQSYGIDAVNGGAWTDYKN